MNKAQAIIKQAKERARKKRLLLNKDKQDTCEMDWNRIKKTVDMKKVKEYLNFKKARDFAEKITKLQNVRSMPAKRKYGSTSCEEEYDVHLDCMDIMGNKASLFDRIVM